MGNPKTGGADAGIFSYENAEYLEKKGIKGFFTDNFLRVEEKKKTRKFRKSQFECNEEKDCFTCPAKKGLPFSYIQKRKGTPDIRMNKGINCPDCPPKARVYKSFVPYHFTIFPRKPLRSYTIEAQNRKEKQMKKDRNTTVEPTNGNMKHNKKFTQFLLRSTEKAAIEFIVMSIGRE